MAARDTEPRQPIRSGEGPIQVHRPIGQEEAPSRSLLRAAANGRAERSSQYGACGSDGQSAQATAKFGPRAVGSDVTLSVFGPSRAWEPLVGTVRKGPGAAGQSKPARPVIKHC
ncbi:semaphorin-3E [Platysternon megacephalum]|uniref:Semaphorin-3E n=1 Tax=Platysternon megacephalum TaxID=55544 RepID=A0A4D9E7J7_9SAUR|nr:semaphorin-3E [Platysternon megacephalum]